MPLPRIYEALHPETKKGTAGGKVGGRGRKKIASDNVSFATDTAAKTGKIAFWKCQGRIMPVT